MMQKSNMKVTEPIEFKFETSVRGSAYQESFNRQIQKEQEDDQLRREVKAQPLPVAALEKPFKVNIIDDSICFITYR